MSTDTSICCNPFEWPDDLAFASPGRLWWLLIIGVVALAYIAMQFFRRTMAVRFTNVALLDKVAPRRPGWYRHIPALLMLLGVTGGVFAYAEPQALGDVTSERATVIMAIDTSLSMQAEDVDPSRIDGAKQAAQEFLDQLPPEINVGLVSFNGIATVRVPPTTNRVAVKEAIADLRLGEATAIGEAIFAGLSTLEDFLETLEGEAPPARIVLMSDGETTVGRPDEAAVEAARALAIPVSTIAFGTDDGVITIPEDPRPIGVPVNEEALAAIADGTGGEFFAAATTDELRAVYEDIGSEVATEEASIPISPWFAGRAIVLLVLASLLSTLWSSRLP